MENLKNEVVSHCKNVVTTKLTAVERALQDLQEAMLSEEKSSVGDKYETGRAMIQLEMENISGKVTEFQDQLKILKRIKEDGDKVKESVSVGSLVETATGIYFVSVSLGAVKIGDKQVFVVSSKSPIGAELMGKSVGDRFQFMQKEIQIKSIL